MKKLFFLLIKLVTSVPLFAEGGCDTEPLDSASHVNLPWFGRNDWLLNYTDSIDAPFICPNCRFGDGPSRTAPNTCQL